MRVVAVLTNRNRVTHEQCRDIKIRNNYIKVETGEGKIYIYLINKVDSFTVERE